MMEISNQCKKVVGEIVLGIKCKTQWKGWHRGKSDRHEHIRVCLMIHTYRYRMLIMKNITCNIL